MSSKAFLEFGLDGCDNFRTYFKVSLHDSKDLTGFLTGLNLMIKLLC